MFFLFTLIESNSREPDIHCFPSNWIKSIASHGVVVLEVFDKRGKILGEVLVDFLYCQLSYV